MNHQENLSISPETLKELTKSDHALADILLPLLNESPSLENLILKYEYGKGKLEHLQIVPDSFKFQDPLTGKFKVTYDIHEFSLCAAIDYLGAENMVINFEIRPTESSLVLTGEYRPERFDEL